MFLVVSICAAGGRWHSLAHEKMESFERNTDAQIWSAVDRLAAERPNISNAAFLDLQRNTGLHVLEDSILCNEDVRRLMPPSSTCFDVLHNFHSGGLAAYETYLFTNRLTEAGLSRAALVELLPRDLQSLHKDRSLDSLCKTLSDCYFGEKLWRIDGSTQLSALPLLHFFAVTYMGPEKDRIPGEFDCFVTLCQRIFSLSLLQFHLQPALLDGLRELEQNHHRKFSSTYGPAAFKPKHHYALHQRDQFRQWQLVLDTKACERKHQAMKRIIEAQVTRTLSFERVVLGRMHFAERQEQKARAESWWRYSIERSSQNGAPELRCPYQTVRVGQPLVWCDQPLCMLVQDIQDTSRGLLLLGLRCSLREEINKGIYEWRITDQRLSKKVEKIAQPWRASKFWRRIANSLVTIW